MPYRFLEEIAIADAAIEIESKDLKELFTDAAEALTLTMISDLNSINKTKEIIIKIKAKDLELLLFEFLEMLIYYKDADQLIFSDYSITIEEAEYSLKCVCLGEKIDYKKHDLSADVKAITMHKFKLEKTDKGCNAFIILDI